MNEVKTFNHPMFGELPILAVGNEHYFGGNEVASSLEYARPYKAISDHCDSEGVLTRDVPTNGGVQQKRFISLGNVSRLIVAASKQSKNPEIQQKAKGYEKWIFDEVIPSVHKHGAYITPDTIDNIISDPDFGIKLLTTLKEEKEKRVQAEQIAQRANLVIEQQRPKVIYAEAVEVSTDAILVKQLAAILTQKGVKIGETRLFIWLRENGFLCKQKGEKWNMPTQRSLDLGIIVIKHGLRTGGNGEIKQTRTPKITGKGQIYFVNKILVEHGLLVI